MKYLSIYLIARAMSTIRDATKLTDVVSGFVVEKKFYKFVNNEIRRARRKPSPRIRGNILNPRQRVERARVRVHGRMERIRKCVLIHRVTIL
jgi:hypothetical protein